MISCGDQSTNSIGHIDRCLDFNGRKIKSGDLVRHRYMCDNHLSTHLLRRNDIGITWKRGDVGIVLDTVCLPGFTLRGRAWKRGDVGIVLDTGHNHRRLGIPLA